MAGDTDGRVSAHRVELGLGEFFCANFEIA
jgi:hypothetical protein